MKKEKKEKIKGVGLIIFCLVMLFNPNVKVIDILPDFIAYFILARMITEITDVIPHFDDLRIKLNQLGILNVCRIPAQMLITMAHTKNAADNDIVTVLTLSFGVLEAILIAYAITHLFNGLFYMGERTNASVLIKPFELSSGRRMSPEELRVLTFIFGISKCALAVIPELLLVSPSPDTPPTALIYRFRALYPYTIILCVTVSLIIGICWLRRAKRYVRAVAAMGAFSSAVKEFYTAEQFERVEKKRILRGKLKALNLMTIATVFSLEMVFEDFRRINLFPHFIFSLLLIFGFTSLVKRSGNCLTVKIFGGIYSAVALVGYITSIVFLSKFQYSDMLYFNDARLLYSSVALVSILEFIALAVFLLVFARAMSEYTLYNTGLSPTSDRYSISDKKFHSSVSKKGYFFALFGIILQLAKCVNVWLQFKVKYFMVDSEFSSSGVVYTTTAPWFGLVVTVLSVLFIGYAVHYFGLLKDEAQMKYTVEY